MQRTFKKLRNYIEKVKRGEFMKKKLDKKNEDKKFPSVLINWDIGTYVKTQSNPYKIMILSN